MGAPGILAFLSPAVMPGLDPGIHAGIAVRGSGRGGGGTWMLGTSPG